MYGNLGWKAFENGEYDRCLELSQKALSLDGDLAYVHFNIGIVYLVKGLNDQAMDEYTKAVAMTRKMSANRPTFEGAVQDLKKYMLLFSSQTSAHEILDILKMELQVQSDSTLNK
jgi:tetratricopeptide (TPR) repeat protein